MISIIKNEFIKARKINTLLMANILIVLAVGVMYFSIIKLGGKNALGEKQLMDLFIKTTLNVLPPLGVILISKSITDEFTNGGMKIYLINPISRNDVLIGKLLFILINLILTIIIQLIVSIVAISILIHIPTMDLITDTMYKYLTIFIPIIGLTAILCIPGVLLDSSRNVILVGSAIIFGTPIITTIYEKLYNYSIFKVISNISESNAHLASNIGLSIAYLAVGLAVSSFIFYNKEIR